ncbi:uracil phosphoribosyltransferase homolog [Oscarella lobularis]|uniref:uracil phosphoribosyltransferase homolog n=1 Tax=Oscarella lobularis TaxID=121494 RepID=UPI003313A45B
MDAVKENGSHVQRAETEKDVIRQTDQVKALQTILRNRDTNRGDFIFYANRLIRLVIEAGLNRLNFEPSTVITPTGHEYHGARFDSKICGVSIMRSGEAMEKALCECCRSVRIGKILIKKSEEEDRIQTLYAKVPLDIPKRQVFLMHPLIDTGATIGEALRVLTKDYGVPESNIVVLSLFASPKGLDHLVKEYAKIRVLTSEIDEDCPRGFGARYFGTS